MIASLAACSSHPLSRALAKHLWKDHDLPITFFRETTGQGIEGLVGSNRVKIGSAEFVLGNGNHHEQTAVFVSIEGRPRGFFRFGNQYRKSIDELIGHLKKSCDLSVISGDNASERGNLRKLLGEKASLLFDQKPEDKLDYIKYLQGRNQNVMMIGDGLNDAGALKQSNVGIAVAEQTNNFTPASDAIIEARQLPKLARFISLCRANKRIVIASFVLSILYNIIGLYFAVQGTLDPLIAAILMPSSSLSILLITFGSSSIFARTRKL
jgi:Cu+-exporting ATPase